MNIRTVRRISQIVFALLFLWLCVVATVGENWWQLRGWPVNWLIQLDPLVALGTLLTTRTLYAGLIWALATVVLTILLGRFFCGWVCPFGALHQAIGYLARRTGLVNRRRADNQYRQSQLIKYYILIFLLSAAAGNILASFIRAGHDQPLIPWAALLLGILAVAGLALVKVVKNFTKAGAILFVVVAAWVALGFVFAFDQMPAAALQTGLLDPIPLMQRSVNLALLPFVDSATNALFPARRFYEGAWLIAAVFFGAGLLNLVIPRFYCRIICPLGALLGVLGRFALWRIGAIRSNCTGCQLCKDDCEGACQPFEKIRTSECVLCLNCLDACDAVQVAYRAAPPAAGEIPSPQGRDASPRHPTFQNRTARRAVPTSFEIPRHELTRRGFMLWAATGLAAVPMLRLSGTAGANWNPAVIRPPGALGEEEFLSRCVKCGQCMRICPTNIIQPAALEAGLEGLWSPVLNFRIGTSGCQLNCIACGQTCPTAALRPFRLDEKLGRGKFAANGPIRIGTAFVDRGRCLPWAMDKPCIVCQENCPVSPKAIFLREQFPRVRDGLRVGRTSDRFTISLDGGALRPGALATGDYYAKLDGAPDSERRPIIGNSADAVTLAPGAAWEPQLGSRIEILARLQLPYVDTRFCTGCGICEHECPVNGLRAIRVTAENESRDPKHALAPEPASGMR